MTAKSPKTATVANQNLTIKWKPPDADCYKVNFEGATIQDIHRAGLGVVIRDHHDMPLNLYSILGGTKLSLKGTLQ